MRVLRPSGELERDLDRLAAEMLCLELGARAVGADLAPLPPPHAPWPAMPPGARFRPAVGAVFFTPPPLPGGGRLPAAELAARLAARLAPFEAHLLEARAVAVSAFTVLRHSNRVAGGTAVVGPRPCPRWPTAATRLPARLLVFAPPRSRELPPHFSARAAFTWVLLGAAAAVAPEVGGVVMLAGPGSAPAPAPALECFNASAAGVLFDGAGRLHPRVPDGADLPGLTLDDFAPFPAAALRASLRPETPGLPDWVPNAPSLPPCAACGAPKAPPEKRCPAPRAAPAPCAPPPVLCLDCWVAGAFPPAPPLSPPRPGLRP